MRRAKVPVVIKAALAGWHDEDAPSPVTKRRAMRVNERPGVVVFVVGAV